MTTGGSEYHIIFPETVEDECSFEAMNTTSSPESLKAYCPSCNLINRDEVWITYYILGVNFVSDAMEGVHSFSRTSTDNVHRPESRGDDGDSDGNRDGRLIDEKHVMSNLNADYTTSPKRRTSRQSQCRRETSW